VRQRRLTFPGVLALLLVTLAGCGGGGGGDETQAEGGIVTTSSTTPPVPIAPSVTVTARDYGFEIPPEIQGGAIRMTLQNDGRFKHQALIVAADGTPPERIRQDLMPIATGAGRPTPDYLRFRGGVQPTAGGTADVGHVSLPAGDYVLVCTLTDADSLDTEMKPDGAVPPKAGQPLHYDLGMATPFTVKTTNPLPMPPTDGGTIVARDSVFDVPPLVTGIRTLLFRNDGEQDHSVVVGEFPDGVDPDAARAAFEAILAAPGKPPPDSLPTPDEVAFAGPLSAGGQTTFAINLKVHRTYVFACYMADRAGGPLHVTKGMVAYGTTPAG
jgi:hypothetical protein